MLALLLLVAGCGNSGGSGQAEDLVDASADGAPDAAGDAAADLGSDPRAEDSATDAAGDAPADVAPSETVADAPPDAAGDSQPDQPGDLAADTLADPDANVPDQEGVDLLQDLSSDIPGQDQLADISGDDAASDISGELPPVCTDTDPDPCVASAPDGNGGCAPLPLTGPSCDDSNPCTGQDTCAAGVCQPGQPLCECQSDSDCAPLEDGTLCNGSLMCDLSSWPYSCVLDADTVVECPEAPGPDAFCFTPQCDPATGDCSLLPANTGKACFDGNACTVGDHCTPDGCKSYFEAACDASAPGVVGTCDPVLGCLFSTPQCGNLIVEAGEECDEGLPNPPGSECTAACQTLGSLVSHPFQVTDMDATYDGSVIVTSHDYQLGPRVQCFGPDRTPKGDPKLWLTLPDGLSKNSDPPRIAASGAGKVALAGWRHYTVDSDAMSRRLTLRLLNLDCTVASDLIEVSPDYIDEFWDMDIDDLGWSAVAWMHPLGHPKVRFFSPAGVEEMAGPELAGGECAFGVHTALSPVGNGGIVTCQGHTTSIWAWTFDASGQLVASAVDVPGAQGHSSWYDSHTVLASAGGQFLVAWTEAWSSTIWYTTLGWDGSLIHTGKLFQIVDPTPFCYDMYRWYNNKNNVLNGRFIVPFVDTGDCFAKDHHGVAFIPVDDPAEVSILSLPEKMQTLAFDARGGNYLLNKDWQAVVNSVVLPQ